MDRDAVIVKLLQFEIADHVANVQWHLMKTRHRTQNIQSLMIKMYRVKDKIEKILSES